LAVARVEADLAVPVLPDQISGLELVERDPPVGAPCPLLVAGPGQADPGRGPRRLHQARAVPRVRPGAAVAVRLADLPIGELERDPGVARGGPGVDLPRAVGVARVVGLQLAQQPGLLGDEPLDLLL